MTDRRNIPANTTDAHTIVLHGMISDLRELLDLAMVAWFVLAFNLAAQSADGFVDGARVWPCFQAFFAVLAVWFALDFRKRARRYRPIGKR